VEITGTDEVVSDEDSVDDNIESNIKSPVEVTIDEPVDINGLPDVRT